MTWLRFLLDRTAVLFLGVAAGAAIGYAFGTGNETKQAVSLAPESAPVATSQPVAPPPPTGTTTPPSTPATTATTRGEVVEPVPNAVPVDPPTNQLASTVSQGKPIHVGVFGDSFGDGVWSGLYKLLPRSDYRVDKFSQASTGFTRYRRLNLESHDDSQIDGQPLDIAVIAFGANDAQGVCDGGHCGTLMSDFWQKVIGGRVESYVNMLRRHGAAIYWVGLPVMRDASFDADALAMDQFYARLMQRLGVPYIDIRPLTVDGQGRYQAYYSDPGGSPKLLRAGDGIHMSMNGYMHVTKGLAARIQASVAAAKGKGDAGAPTP
ncbi:SGNH/GDSL hydrolase family protein [Sphingomonas sp. ASY06-1R]|uniref:SGNH/GDSL hydrolase family protein n=1 Tax=Sphingomonas sp. ASY06-1R TaxID=3445771 RepID=UPI003FA32706